MIHPMDIRLLRREDEEKYGEWVNAHPQGNLWQSLDWKRFQESLGHETKIYAAFVKESIIASALVVIDRTTGGYAVWDIPRGPLSNDDPQAISALLTHIQADARQQKGLVLYFSPAESPLPLPFRTRVSPRHEQPEATVMVDLQTSKEEILQRMHSKGRYNIKVAEKHGVIVEQSRDAESFHALLAATAERDQFTLSSKKQYFSFLEQIPGSFLLMAYAEHKPVAGLMGVIHGSTGIYYYGASSYEHRALMAPYLLQWEAIKYCKAQGATRYDLLGIAPPDAPANHPWKGITDFKNKFGGHIIVYPPEQMLLLRPMLYRALRLKRKLFG